MHTTLKEAVAQRNAAQCVVTSQHPAFVEFRTSARQLQGFALSQLLHYTLDANPAAERTPDAPPERLALAFSTADVVLTGWRLDRLCEDLRESRLALVKPLPDAARYEQLEPRACAVAHIEITPLGKP